jgi:hypothetical protein
MPKKFQIKSLNEFINESKEIDRYSLTGKYMNDMEKDPEGQFVLYKDAGKPKNVTRMVPIGNGRMKEIPNGDWMSYNDINEAYSSTLGLKKWKWAKVEPKDHPDLADEFFDMIQTAYGPIGGHVKVRAASDVFKEKKWNMWKVIDLDEDPEADLVLFGQEGKYGAKSSGVGHDGSKAAKREYIDAKGKAFKKRGFYGEVSKVFAEIMLKKYDVPIVDNQEDVEKVLNKKVEWLGEHPTDKSMPGKGWYRRKLGAEYQVKTLVGKPKI